MFISLSTDQAHIIRQKLLETLAAEADRGVRNKISDAVAEIARQYSENGMEVFFVMLRDLAHSHMIQARLGPTYSRCSSNSAWPLMQGNGRSRFVFSLPLLELLGNSMKKQSRARSPGDLKMTQSRYARPK
jgi:hypothetical protein